MLPLAYLALTGGTVLTTIGVAQRRPRKRLIDHWQTPQQSSPVGASLQTADSVPTAVSEVHSEADTDRYLLVATVTMGVTAVGALAFPVVSLLSTPAIVYLYFPVAQSAWHGLTQERRLRGTVLDCLVAVGLLVERWFFVTTFACWLYWAGRKLTFLIDRRTGQLQCNPTEQSNNVVGRAEQELNARAEALVDQLAWPALGLGALALNLHGLESAFAVLNCNFIETVRVAAPLATLNYLTLAQRRGIQIYDTQVLERLTHVDTLLLSQALWRQDDQAALQAALQQVIEQHQARPLMIYLLTEGAQPASPTLFEELALLPLVSQTIAGVMPASDSVALIEQLQHQHHTVCVGGAGTQDRSALQKADVAIAVGDEAATLADSIHIQLTEPTLRQLPEVLRLAHAYQRNLQVTTATAYVPGLICVSGVFFLKYGLVNSVFWYCVSTAAGIGNGLLPLLIDRAPATEKSALAEEANVLSPPTTAPSVF